MIKVSDFGNKELINAIVGFIRSGQYLNFAEEYAQAIEDGSWLDYYNDKLENELPHHNS